MRSLEEMNASMEPALTKKQVKSAAKEITGKPVSDKQLKNVQEDLQGAATAVQQTGELPQDASVARRFRSHIPRQSQPSATEQLLYSSLIAAVPTLVGAAIGGGRGAAIGATAGGQAVGQMVNIQQQQLAQELGAEQQAAEMELRERDFAERRRDRQQDNERLMAQLGMQQQGQEQRQRQFEQQQALRLQELAQEQQRYQAQMQRQAAQDAAGMRLRQQELALKMREVGLDPAGKPLPEEQLPASVRTKNLSPAEKKVDENFAKDYADFIAGGGSADVEKNIRQLQEVIGALRNTNAATGPIVGTIPKGMRDVVLPRSAAMQDAVEEVVQRNLRLVLGAQFTEKEGERLISRAYNPRLSEAENIKRLERLSKAIADAAAIKADAAAYFEDRGTLKGWGGGNRLQSTLAAIKSGDVLEEAPSRQRKTSSEKEARAAAPKRPAISPALLTKNPEEMTDEELDLFLNQ